MCSCSVSLIYPDKVYVHALYCCKRNSVMKKKSHKSQATHMKLHLYLICGKIGHVSVGLPRNRSSKKYLKKWILHFCKIHDQKPREEKAGKILKILQSLYACKWVVDTDVCV